MISSVPSTPTTSTSTNPIINPLSLIMGQHLGHLMNSASSVEEHEDPRIKEEPIDAPRSMMTAHMHDVQMKEVA